jgi:hypothetical protein
MELAQVDEPAYGSRAEIPAEDLETLDEWVEKYRKKYPAVGRYCPVGAGVGAVVDRGSGGGAAGAAQEPPGAAVAAEAEVEAAVAAARSATAAAAEEAAEPAPAPEPSPAAVRAAEVERAAAVRAAEAERWHARQVMGAMVDQNARSEPVEPAAAGPAAAVPAPLVPAAAVPDPAAKCVQLAQNSRGLSSLAAAAGGGWRPGQK